MKTASPVIFVRRACYRIDPVVVRGIGHDERVTATFEKIKVVIVIPESGTFIVMNT